MNTTLYPNHRQDLAASGLTDETIRAAGVHSESNHRKIAGMLNRKTWSRKNGGALIFPFFDENGAITSYQVKADNPPIRNGKAVKYVSPTGGDLRLYVPPGGHDALSNTGIPLLITEGAKKVLRAWQDRFVCVGLTGVECWHGKKSSALIPDLARIEWKGRPVFIVFDSDAATNDLVRTNEVLLADVLRRHGANVKVVRLPPAPDGAKVGLDDFLVAHGPDALRQLMAEAEDPPAPEPDEVKVQARRLDPATEARRCLATREKDGVCRLRWWRSEFYWWSGGAYRVQPEDEVKGRLVKWIAGHAFDLSANVVNNVMMHVKSQAMLAGAIDAPTWLLEPGPWPADEVLAARNGLFHLPSIVDSKVPWRTDKTPRFFVLNALDYDVDLEVPEPKAWLDFLRELWPDEPEAIHTLQEWFGYTLTPDTRQHKALMVIGPKRGRKGTVARVNRALVGPANVAGPTLASFGSNFGLWPLIGKSLAIISDARLSGRSDKAQVCERLLSVTGEDALTIDRKNLQPVTVMLNTRFMLLTNEVPRLTDASGALASRFIFLPLTRSWYGKEDVHLMEKLLPELPGILVWAIGGWARLRERGYFVQPPSGRALAEEMEELGSPVTAFVKECCDVDPAAEVERKTLFNAYQTWCQESGKKNVDDDAGFGRNLRAAVPHIADRRHRLEGQIMRFYVGIRLKPGF